MACIPRDHGFILQVEDLRNRSVVRRHWDLVPDITGAHKFRETPIWVTMKIFIYSIIMLKVAFVTVQGNPRE